MRVGLITDYFRAFARRALTAVCCSFLISACVAAEATHPQFYERAYDIVADLIRMEACRASWNYHLRHEGEGLNIASNAEIEVMKKPYTNGGVPGVKISYEAAQIEVCGWYFVPDDASSLAQTFSYAQIGAIDKALPSIRSVGEGVLRLIPSKGKRNGFMESGENYIVAENVYVTALEDATKKLNIGNDDLTFFTTMPVVTRPSLKIFDDDIDAKWDRAFGKNSATLWYIRKNVIDDLKAFDAD